MKLTSNSSNNISIYLFISVLFYYPIAACIISLTNLPSTPTNIGIRALFSIISVILIFKSFFIRASTKFNTFVYWLLLFWVIYAIRVLYDVVILEIPCDGKSSFLVLSMVFANCFLPMLAILVTSKKINLKTLMTYTYYILIISNVLIIIKVFLVQDIDESFFYRRAEVKQLVDGEDVGVLNPITIGFTGNLLAILALSKLLILKVNKGRTFDLLVLFLGLINLVVGASRGPFIIFLLILFLILYRHFKITQ